MFFKKIDRKVYEMVGRDQPSKLFYIGKNDLFHFKIGFFRGLSINYLYQKAMDDDKEEEFWDYLQKLYDESNLKDKVNIWTIWKELNNL